MELYCNSFFFVNLFISFQRSEKKDIAILYISYYFYYIFLSLYLFCNAFIDLVILFFFPHNFLFYFIFFNYISCSLPLLTVENFIFDRNMYIV